MGYRRLLLGLATLSWAGAEAKNVEERKIQVMNESGVKVEIHWINPSTKERVLQTDPHLFNGASFNLNSFRTHHFEVRELPGARSGVCAGPEQQCRVGYYTVNDNDDQVVFVRPGNGEDGFEMVHTDNKRMARESATELLSECQRRAIKAISATEDLDPEAAKDAIGDVVSCVENSIAAELMKSSEEISFQKNIRTKMGELLENYTCADDGLETTKPEETTFWQDDDGYYRDVHIMIDRPSSKVHVVENFITEDECKAMEEAAAPILHKATVADGKGGSEFSESRKALQAGIKVPWDKEEEGHPIATLSRRVYDYVNHVLDLDIEHNGQEDLMSIQYEGRGDNETEPDRYMPHCDGDCTGLQFKTGTRMATMVMYCEIPERGGATNFRNAGLHIVPKKRSATFFSYIDPESMKMDTGFTEHSGCPVIEGEKKIVTQWVRLGVDGENPWHSFNTLGVKVSDAAEQ